MATDHEQTVFGVVLGCMSTERCGHVQELDGMDDIGGVCCWRPVRTDDDRCVWHTDELVSKEEYRRHRLDSEARLDGAQLRRASLAGADWLAGCTLVESDFTETTVDNADLSDTDLRRATFRDVDARGAIFDRANLHDATFTFADLRGASFRDALLYRVGLTDVRINQESAFDETVSYEREIEDATNREQVISLTDSATWVYRELQRLFDENAIPDEVEAYHRREMNLRRRTAWKTRKYWQAIKLAGSRWVMRYGTSPWRVVGNSAVLILVCALLYPLTGGIQEVEGQRTITYQLQDPVDAPAGYRLRVFLVSLYFSVVTFATLGYGDIQPVGTWARMIAGTQTLLGSLLLALLVFVLTRSVR